LEGLVQQFGNHALAINLLAEYLRMFEKRLVQGQLEELKVPNV